VTLKRRKVYTFYYPLELSLFKDDLGPKKTVEGPIEPKLPLKY